MEPAVAVRPVPDDILVHVDQRVIMRGISWATYESARARALIATRGERAVPRFTYLPGTLEDHEPFLITAFVLTAGCQVVHDRSELLPEVDLRLLAELAARFPEEAIEELRKHLDAG